MISKISSYDFLWVWAEKFDVVNEVNTLHTVIDVNM